MAKLSTLEKNALVMNATGNMHLGFAYVLLKLQFFSKGTLKVESNLKTLRHAGYYYSTLRGSQSCVTSIVWILEAFTEKSFRRVKTFPVSIGLPIIEYQMPRCSHFLRILIYPKTFFVTALVSLVALSFFL